MLALTSLIQSSFLYQRTEACEVRYHGEGHL